MKKSPKVIGIVNVKTKSNFRNLNFVDLPLLEIHGQRVTALVYNEETGKLNPIDFNLYEVLAIYTMKIDVQYAKDLLDKYLPSAI